MSFFNDVLAMGVVGVVLVAGPALGAPAGQQAATSAAAKVDDSTLKSRIAANLKKNATIAAHEVDVDVNKGIVTLKGVVRTADEKARATQLATINGVTEVRNEIVVDAAAAKSRAGKAIDATKQAGQKTADVTKDAAQKTGDTTKEIAGTAGKKTKEAASATGEAITDGWITTKVRTKFVDETLLKDSHINVDTNDHVVTLRGTVTSSAAKVRAAEIAGGTEGVTRVVNQLVVKGT
jgi:hyperosmotically inducible periplasmic protein